MAAGRTVGKCVPVHTAGYLDRIPLLSRKQEPVLGKLLSPPRALRNKQGWTGVRRELVSHPFGLLCPEFLSGGTGRNSPFSLTVTQARVDPFLALERLRSPSWQPKTL